MRFTVASSAKNPQRSLVTNLVTLTKGICTEMKLSLTTTLLLVAIGGVKAQDKAQLLIHPKYSVRSAEIYYTEITRINDSLKNLNYYYLNNDHTVYAEYKVNDSTYKRWWFNDTTKQWVLINPHR